MYEQAPTFQGILLCCGPLPFTSPRAAMVLPANTLNFFYCVQLVQKGTDPFCIILAKQYKSDMNPESWTKNFRGSYEQKTTHL